MKPHGPRTALLQLSYGSIGDSVMDPDATLRRAVEALDAGDLDEGQAALNDYHRWRTDGGFEPEGGDELARRLTQRLQGLVNDQQGPATEPKSLGECLRELAKERGWWTDWRERQDGDDG